MDAEFIERLKRFEAEQAARGEAPAEIPHCPGVSAEKSAARQDADAEPAGETARKPWEKPAPAAPAPKPFSVPTPRITLEPPAAPRAGDEEKKISLGDVAKARKDYEREPFEKSG